MSKKITSLNDFKSKKIDCPNCKSPSIAPHTPFVREDALILTSEIG